MGNITDDIRTRFADFDAFPFNEVDALALAQLAYVHMPECVPRHPSRATVPLAALLRAEDYDDMCGSIWSPAMNVELIRAMAESPRWRGVRAGGYADVTDEGDALQFSAGVFDLGNGVLVVAFRGTDSTIVGWKEDFMMAFRRPVAAQRSAARYLHEVASWWRGLMIVVGHSKGGNLAVYAAAEAPADVQDRIVAVHSFDGPGFDDAYLASAGFRRIADRVHKTVPEGSIIGMLFEGSGAGKAVSCASDAGAGADDTPADRPGLDVIGSAGMGVMQHFALNWQVADGRFVRADGLSASAQYASGVINGWMNRYDDERRRVFIENLFAILESAGYRTFGELAAHWTQAMPAMIQAARGVDAEERDVMIAVLGGLLSSALKPGTASAGEPASTDTAHRLAR
ncbi:Mbeg1-like protein [Bifidobacterium moraviense]|nr:Mbeg1-like protein [Bifidobacterium sp. DSM 109958]